MPERLRRIIAIHSPQSWGHFNLLGEYDFSKEKLQDNTGVLPPQSTPLIIPENWGKAHSARRALVEYRAARHDNRSRTYGYRTEVSDDHQLCKISPVASYVHDVLSMTEPHELTGLFLGAGASYECGMPLVCDLTTELTNWLTPEKLRSLNESWRLQGGGYPEQVIHDFTTVLSRPDQHYESLLGYLEVQFNRQSPLSQQYHGLYSWLVDLVYHLLYLRHKNNFDYIQRNLPYYDGLSVFSDQNRPLWIFSLNHDVIIECLSIRMDIPLSSGFTGELVYLPRRNKRSAVIGQLKAEVLPGTQLDSSAMPFFLPGTRGINLLKIHGGLDIFTFRDGRDLLRILPVGNGIDGPVRALQATNDELVYRPDVPVRATNQIAYADQSGELQFLRRSLLAGAFKFDSRRSQVLPPSLLRHFRSYLNYIRFLVCIGYGFADDHINTIIREWLEFSQKRRLVLVAPGVSDVPLTFLHIASQVELHSSNATDYLDECAGIVRPRREANYKRFVALIRQSGESAISELITFNRTRQIDKLIELLKTLPVHNGDIDFNALDMPFDKIIQEVLRQICNPEEIIDDFINSRSEAL